MNNTSNTHNHHKKSTRPMHYEKAFTQQKSQQMIKDALDDLAQQGFDFQYSSQQPLPKKHKQMLRTVYLRFNCDHCTRELKKTKRWTSTRGTVGITFQFVKQQDPKYPLDMLIFHFKIYRMQCKKCFNYGQPEIYDSQLQKVENYFCEIVANILNEVKPQRKKRNKREIKVPDLRNHLEQLCQACKLRKCQFSGVIRKQYAQSDDDQDSLQEYEKKYQNKKYQENSEIYD